MLVLSRRHVAAVIVAFGLVAAACGSSSKSSSGSTPTSANATITGQCPSADLTGSLNVFAAASLTKAFTAEKAALEAACKDLHITNNFAGSQTLAAQIQQGAPADVFASASATSMQPLVDANLVNTPQTFTKNKLQIAVAPGNPKGIKTLADLEKSGVILVLADPTVPAGKYARQAFQQAGLPAPQPKSNELDVKAALAKLTSGEADAVVVYVTDVLAAGNQARGIDIPDAQNVIATYPIATVKASKNAAAAAAYVTEIVSGTGQAALKASGFLPPS